MATDPDWLHGHPHQPNPAPPSPDPTIRVLRPNRSAVAISVAELRALPVSSVPDCFIVSTGHGTSGPFTFAGTRLGDLLRQVVGSGVPWHHVDVVSADGFGTRLSATELDPPDGRAPLLAYAVDSRPLTRDDGLVRLIVPGEVDDALRQVKWVAELRVDAMPVATTDR